MKNYTERTIKYYDRIANAYIKSGGAVVLKNKINRFVELLPGRKILDVACGPGHDTDYLSRMGFNCLGIDLSKKMIQLARQNFKGKFKIMDFFNLKLKNDSFDGMWCSSILVHIKRGDLPKLLENSRKVLKNNGILGIITAQKQKRVRKQDDTRMYTVFEKKELGHYLEKAGYKILISETFSYGGKNRIFMISKKVIS